MRRKALASPGKTEIRVIKNLRDLQSLRSAWQGLCNEAECSGSVFQTSQWVLPWCSTFSPRYIYVVTAWRHGRLAGLAPFFFPDGGNDLLFLGNPLNDEETFLVNRLEKHEIVAALFHAILDNPRIRSFAARTTADLSIVPDGPPPPDGVRAWKASAIGREPGASLVLPQSWDEYLGCLTSLQKSKALYVLRRAETDLGIGFAVDSAPRIAPSEIHTLLKLREESMTHRGLWQLCPPAAKNSNFSCFVERICSEAEAGSSGIYLAKLYSGKSLIAAGLYLSFQKTVMKYCQGWATRLYRYSPGTLLDLKMIEWCIAKQIRIFEMGRGDEPYKRRLGAYVYELTTWRFDTSPGTNEVRTE